MRKRGAAARMALCGVLAALAVALMFLDGTVPFASIACPVLASLVLIPVYCECGWKWGLLWYAAVAALGALLAPEKEAAVLFVFFGYYPMLAKLIGVAARARLRGGQAARVCQCGGLCGLWPDALCLPSDGCHGGLRGHGKGHAGRAPCAGKRDVRDL